MTTLAYVAEATASGTTVTIPASAQAGDIALLFDRSSGISTPALVSPSGWTLLANTTATATLSGLRAAVHYKVLGAGDPGTSITGMSGRKFVIVFRPSQATGWVLGFSTPVTYGGTGNPPAQTIAASGAAAPVLLWGFLAATVNVTYTSSTGFTLTTLAAPGKVAYQIQNTTPANGVLDSNAYSSGGTLQSAYISLIPTAVNFAATPAAKTTVTADFATAVWCAASAAAKATATAALVTAITFSAEPATAKATVTANLLSPGAFRAASAAVASVTADLGTAIPLGGTASAKASATAAISTAITCAATPAAIATATADLFAEYIWRGSPAAIATATADLSTAIRAAASAAGKSTATSALTTAITCQSAPAAKSTVTAALRAPVGFNALPGARSTATAALDTAIQLAASAAAKASVTAGRLEMHIAVTAVEGPPLTLWLAEITSYDPNTSSVVTWRFSTGLGFDNGGTFYEPRIENPAQFTRSLGLQGAGGRASTSVGELTLVNNDGELNALADYFFDGRTLTLKVGDDATAYADFVTVLVASIETVAVERERVSVRLRDRAVTLDKPFTEVKYAGTNALPLGIEGTADDIKGQTKPRLFGRVALLQPVLVNTSKLIYQVNAAAVDAILNVYDAGAYLSQGPDYSSQSDMEANAPSIGGWRAWHAGGCFRLGSAPYSQVSASVAEKWDYLQNSAAGIITRVLTEKGWSAGTDWVAADLTALNQKNAGSLGVVVNGDETTASLLDRITQSVGAWWGFDSLNRFRVARLDAPSGTPVVTITDEYIIEIERQPDPAPPLWRAGITCDKNYLVQDKKSLAGVVPQDRVAWFSLEAREQIAESAGVKTTRLLAEEGKGDSLLNGISQGQAEAARRLALFSVRRDAVNVTVAMEPFTGLDIGHVIELQTTRLGYDAGKLFTITGLGIDYQRGLLDLQLFG